MRTLLVIAASFLMAQYGMAQRGGGRGGPGRGGGQQAQQPVAPPNPGLECFDHLTQPEFPKTALQQHIDGSVWTTIQVGTPAAAGKIDTQVVSAYGDGPKLLVPPVEKAVRSSTFKADCAGKTVSVVFRYQLNGEAAANPNVTVRNEPPNIVWIESQPEKKPVAAAPPSAAKKL